MVCPICFQLTWQNFDDSYRLCIRCCKYGLSNQHKPSSDHQFHTVRDVYGVSEYQPGIGICCQIVCGEAGRVATPPVRLGQSGRLPGCGFP